MAALGASRRRSAKHDDDDDDDDGFITAMTLVLILLLSATALVIVTSAASSTLASRNGRAFVDARTSMETAKANALGRLNADAAADRSKAATAPWTSPWALSVTGTGAGGAGGADGQWAYGTDANARTLTTSGTVAVDSTADQTAGSKKTQSQTIPLRARYVSSTNVDGNGSRSYGVAANVPAAAEAPAPNSTLGQGVWGVPVSTSSSSAFRGTVNGEWDVYNGTDPSTLTFSGGGPRFINSFADNATASVGGASVPVRRSQFNAYFDRNGLVARISDLAFADPGCTSYTINGLQGGDYLCAPQSITLSGTPTWSGVKTLVVRGDVRIEGDLNPGGGQLHIYASGDVTFDRGSGDGGSIAVTRRVSNVFIFAPEGSCAIDSPYLRSLTMVGSLACQSISMIAPAGGPAQTNYLSWVLPLPDAAKTDASPAGPTPKAVPKSSIVYYAEQAGYADSRTP